MKKNILLILMLITIIMIGCNPENKNEGSTEPEETESTEIVIEEEEETSDAFGPEEGLYDRTYLLKADSGYSYHFDDATLRQQYDDLYAEAFADFINTYKEMLQYQPQGHETKKTYTAKGLEFSEHHKLQVIPVGSYFEQDYGFDLNNVGYTYVDLDSDGTVELVFGILKDANTGWTISNMIEKVYTLVDGKPLFVFEGGSRDLLYLGSDGYVYEYGSSGAANSGVWKEHFDSSSVSTDNNEVWGGRAFVEDEFLGYWDVPVYIDEMITDIDEQAKNPQFQITEEEYSTLNEEWGNRIIDIDWLRLADYLEVYYPEGI